MCVFQYYQISERSMMVCIEEEIIMEYMTMPATQEILQLPENTFLPVMSELTTARMCVSQAF